MGRRGAEGTRFSVQTLCGALSPPFSLCSASLILLLTMFCMYGTSVLFQRTLGTRTIRENQINPFGIAPPPPLLLPPLPPPPGGLVHAGQPGIGALRIPTRSGPGIDLCGNCSRDVRHVVQILPFYQPEQDVPCHGRYAEDDGPALIFSPLNAGFYHFCFIFVIFDVGE